MSYAERSAETVGDYQRFAIAAHGKLQTPAGAYDLEASLWRPAKPGAALLVDMGLEPAASSTNADLRQIARGRRMTILFVAPALERLPEPIRPRVLHDLVVHLRKTAGVKRVLGRGAGHRADFLQALASDGAPLFDGLLLHDLGANPAPSKTRVVETWGSDAYWRPAPRPPDGAAGEIANRRRYFLAGTAPQGDAPAANCAAPVNGRAIAPALRALFVALDDWVAKGVAPPPSRAPRAADLAPSRSLVWPKIPNLPSPPSGERQAPKLDSDGNETVGLRLPDHALPLATFTGFNAQKDKAGPPCAAGAVIPFAVTKAEREKTRDPRPSLVERYGSRAYFVATMRVIADKLVKERLLLPEDADAYVAAAKNAPF